jgi:TonB-dependent starch-binding outer membrane protein SusC
MRRNLQARCLIAALVFTCSMVWAQERTVSGRVTSSDDGAALPGVNVVLKGTTQGVVTDADGNFRVNVPEGGGVLVFTFIGLKSSEVDIGNRSVIDMQMDTDITQLSEVVVVAYGTQEKRALTGSVVSVGQEQIKNQPLRGIDQALQGLAAGVQVTQNSGTPGSGIAVRVRGSSSILAGNEPLYVVDGIPINNGNYSNIGVGNQQTNALNDLSPTDIESMEVLKDAAAAALYGSRAANGVVLITTKRGKSKKPSLNVNFYSGFQETWKDFEPLTGAEFVELLADNLVARYGVGSGTTASPEGVANGDGTVNTPTLLGSGAQRWRSKYDLASWFWASNSTFALNGGIAEVSRNGNALEVNDATFYLDPSTAPSTNWFDQVTRKAQIYSGDVSLSGGADKVRYFSSVSYFKQDGIIAGSGFERVNGRLNLDVDVTEKLKVSAQTGFSRSLNNRTNNDNNIFGVLSTAVLNAPDFPVRNAAGNYVRDPRNSIDNPVAQALEPTNIAASNRLLGSLKGNYMITKDLTFASSLSIDYLYFREDRFVPTTTAQGAGSNGLGNANTVQDVNWLNENVLSYSKTFSDEHSISALVGASFQESTQNTILASASGFPGNSVRVLSAGAVKTDASSNATSWALTSYFGRLNYDFRSKYFVSGSFRADASSRFSEDNRVGYFPSASAAWLVSEEGFAKGINAINLLKLRVSYGLTGNQDFGNFSYLSLTSPGNNYLQVGGLAPTQIANENLKWETTSQLNAGLDLAVFDKISFTFDYYIKKTSDLLLSRPIPSSSGFTTFTQNIGDMENKGIELGISATPVSTSNGLTWKTDFNIAFNKNKVVKLAADVPPSAQGFGSWLAEGEPLGAFRGFKVVKIFQTQEEINTANAGAPDGVYTSTLTRPGDIHFEDLDGDGDLTSSDQDIIGSAQPDFFGGWTNTLGFKGIDLTIFAQYVYGNEIYNNSASFHDGMNGIFGQSKNTLNRWTPANTNTDVPRGVHADPNNNRRVSDRWIEDGSFVRLKSVVLGYSLPKSLIDKARLSNVRIYASAQNLITITNYSGLDPEVNTFSGSNTALGTDFLTFPQARTITFGVNLGF